MSLRLHRAPREPDANGYTLGCLRFGSLGVRLNDLLSTYPERSDYLSPSQVASSLRGWPEIRATHVRALDE
eukprot:10880993-Alexandrium_andersonii.AAC.1